MRTLKAVTTRDVVHVLRVLLGMREMGRPAMTPLNKVLVRLRNCRPPFVVFGGAIRDLCLGAQPRDIDVVMKDLTRPMVWENLQDLVERKSGFGGYRLAVDGTSIDLWSLEDTHGIKKLELAPSFENLVSKTTFFNIEAIAIDDGFEVYDGGFFEAMETRVLDVKWYENPFPALCLVRALSMLKRFDMTAGPGLLAFFKEHRNAATRPALMALQKKHYGEERFTERDLDHWEIAR